MDEKKYTLEEITQGIDGYLYYNFKTKLRTERDSVRNNILSFIELTKEKKEEEKCG